MKDEFIKGELLDGRFETVAPLNHGSFGMVFLARDTFTGSEVAIKCSAQSTLLDGASNNGILTELECHQRLNPHNHLVNLVHHFETPHHTYLVLEFCSQGDLYEAIRVGRGPLETEHVRNFMLELIDAIGHMHSKGLYHRDIKPENIFLTQDGVMKLGDFGLATDSPWCYDACVGSDRYMAPEQYDSAGTGYSPAKADIWSIGVCLLNVLFSRNPFVTPTESDILFADYRRDRQSMFDVFPNMSQDTFEILVECMNIDPGKRDLAAARLAVLRAVSFTTDDDSFDEFCAEERDPVRVTANRSPLRTPSIMSPNLTAGESFPWSKALRSSPRPQRQLSAIPDNESYEESLFPASEKDLNLSESWFSVKNTPSLASVLDSGLGSFKSMAIRRPAKKISPPRPDPVTVPASLPAQAAIRIPTISSVFGKKNTVAKSWSEMWEEDEESEHEEAATRSKHASNSRTWSQDSHEEVTVRPGVLTETKSHSSMNIPRCQDFKAPSPVKVNGSPKENFIWTTRRRSSKTLPSKQTCPDKWSVLGTKRRNPTPAVDPSSILRKKASMSDNWRSGNVSFNHEHGNNWYRRGSREKSRPAYLNQHWRRDLQQSPQHKSSIDSIENEWVGGWQDFHL